MQADRPVRNYSGSRRFWERLQGMLTPLDWPAVLAGRLGASTEVRLQREFLVTSQPLGTSSEIRVAFASDFHAGPTTSQRVLGRAANLLAAAAPDILLLGGDFVSIRAGYVGRVTDLLTSIPAPAGKFAVLGNHDYWAGGREIIRALERADVEVLTNRNRRLPPPFQQVTVCGLDDDISGYPDAEPAFLGATRTRLLLMHSPSGLLDIGARPFTMAFAGHTHGGQIALPSGYPLYVPHGRLSRRYCAGRFDIPEQGVLLVSRGIGCSTVPVRWNAPPEVHLCSIRSVAP
jgi:uncharacterized protein